MIPALLGEQHAAQAALPAALEIENLAVSYRIDGRDQRAVHGASFRIAPGEVVALVGESGSGKTTIAQAVLGLLPANGRIEGGAIRLHGADSSSGGGRSSTSGADIARWSQTQLESIRGARIGLIPQDPGSSLNPVRTIGAQVAEVLRIHRYGDRRAIEQRVLHLLDRVGLAPPELRARQYPHELSGGMKQRVLIAIAIALRPGLLIADEPTSALDVTVQRRVLDLIDDLRRENGTSVLLVTHDLGVAADRADRLVVLQGGRIQEQGAAADVIGAPRSAYARRLLADAPSLAAPRLRPPLRFHAADGFRVGDGDPTAAAAAVVVEGLTQDFPVGGSGRAGMFRAVDDVSFSIRRGTTHALVGESGSGKTTTARTVAGFQTPTSGRIRIEGVELTGLRREALRQFRRRVQLVYQNPFASLDPRMTVRRIVEEPLRNFEPIARPERARRVGATLERVGLSGAFLDRLPRELSGGQRQRVAIARALILEPRILVLDEAVSALDVTVQAQVLRLLHELQATLGLTYLFVSHDLAVVRQVADTVSVLHRGHQVDSGTVSDVFERPGSSYTRELIAAIPGPKMPIDAGGNAPAAAAAA